MSLDPATLLMSTVLITGTVGALLVFAWAQNRAHAALAAWGCGDLAAAVSGALLLTRNHAPDVVSITIAFAVLAAAYGVIWSAARIFSGRLPKPHAAAAGMAVWLAACTFPPFFHSTEARVTLISSVSAAYTLAAAWELWRDRRERLLSRYPLIACLGLHAGLVAARGAIAASFALPAASQALDTPWLTVFAIEPTLLVVVSGFLQLSMAKERCELVQRRAAAVDPLTGVANRRAFFEEGETRLAAAMRRQGTAALLLFDLDRFKQINDGYGHQAGDHVLKAFAERAGMVLGPLDLFARIGGEEFAGLLTDVDRETALALAEDCRTAVRKIELSEDGEQLPLSVSIGVATSAPGDDLDGLLRRADQALYQAKSAGRNCVRHDEPHPHLQAA